MRENERKYQSPSRESGVRVEAEKNSYPVNWIKCIWSFNLTNIQRVFKGRVNQQLPSFNQSMGVMGGNANNVNVNQGGNNNNVNNSFGNNNNGVIGPTVVRTLTLKQLKDMIEEIYASKQKYDKKYLEAKMPRETLEQHMYTFLNQKYGLKVKPLLLEYNDDNITYIRYNI